jgi:hypothetical protein
MDNFFPGDDAIAIAKQSATAVSKHTTNPQATWCVVTKKSIWSPSYHYPNDEARLRAKIGRKHTVVLVAGISNGNAELGYRSPALSDRAVSDIMSKAINQARF